MPNRGYPIHLFTAIPGTVLALHVQGSSISVLCFLVNDDPGRRGSPGGKPAGEPTTDEVTFLQVHLAYRSVVSEHDDRSSLRIRLVGSCRMNQLAGCVDEG